MKLEGGERGRILRGDFSALKREDDPGDVTGTQITLQQQRARRVPLYSDPKFQGHAREIVGHQEVPAFRTFWIELEQPRRHKKGHWLVPFTVHDERQSDRVLRAGGPPGPPREPGLRTRQVPKDKGEGVGTFTDETARGYGGGGRQALDFGGVDDDELKRQRTLADERWRRHQEGVASDERDRQQMKAMREQLKAAMRELGPEGRAHLLAGVARLVEEARSGELNEAA